MIQAVDLFCGAGGTSTGILKAASGLRRRISLTAVNHWPIAVNTHSLNHPSVKHLCESVENLHPVDLVGGGRLDLLAASCECRFFSNARGGGPCNEQSRSQAWQLVRWATDIHVENLLMENVREFLNWGPIHPRTKRPIKSRRGEFFRSFVQTLASLGYKVDWRVQRASDYGDPTSRERLILQARKGCAITWPAPTHGPGRGKPYRSARECIDWNFKGVSIFKRKKPLCANTLRRIINGLRQQGPAAEPFLVMLNGTTAAHLESSHRSVNEPMTTVLASGNHLMLCEPIIVQTDQTGGNGLYSRSVDKPLGSVVSKQNMLLIEPIIVKYYGTGVCQSVNEPIDAITTKDRFLLVQPKTGRTVAELDILARMLQPHELQLCHSFPKSYRFSGNKAQQTKQIGNSVPVELAAAHAEAILS